MEKSKLQKFEKDFLEFWTKEWADKFEKENERGWVDLLLSGKPFHLRFFAICEDGMTLNISGIVDPVSIVENEDGWGVLFTLKGGIGIYFFEKIVKVKNSNAPKVKDFTAIIS